MTEERPVQEFSGRKVLVLISSLQLGGAERQIVDLANHLARLGIHVHLGVLRGNVSELYELDRRIAVLADLVPRRRRKISRATAKFAAIVRLLTYVRQNGIDHVLSSLDEANVIGSILARVSSRPLTFVALQVYIFGNVRFTRSIWERFLLRRTFRRADRVIAVSSLVERSLVAEFGVQRERIATIGNCLSVRSIAMQSCAKPEFEVPDGQFLIFVGRLSADKRVDLLIQAYAGLLKDVPDLRLLILGEGNMRAKLEGLVARLGLDGRVLMPGATANPYPFLKAARALVLCSEAEGFGNVVLEAITCGTPCVCTGNIGVAVDFPEDGKWIAVVREDGVDALREGIRRCLDGMPKWRPGDADLPFDEDNVMPHLMQVVFGPARR